jgi:hypothetical protein
MTTKQMVAIPNRSAADVNGPHAWSVYFEARNVVPHKMFATIARTKPELNLK